jgi:hypothetical protein
LALKVSCINDLLANTPDSFKLCNHKNLERENIIFGKGTEG